MCYTVKWIFTQPLKMETYRFSRDTIFVHADGTASVVLADTLFTVPIPDQAKPIKTKIEWK